MGVLYVRVVLRRMKKYAKPWQLYSTVNRKSRELYNIIWSGVRACGEMRSEQ